MKKQIGILLINLGTPNAPDKQAVRRYLREFLSDPRVIDISGLLRWLLLNFIILPFRPKQTSRAYQQIWTKDGSPLLLHSEALAKQLQETLGNDYFVVLGMRYGKPSIASALQKLKQQRCHKIKILPLFPQYSSAVTGSALAKTMSLIQQWRDIPSLDIIADFYQHPLFIQTSQQIILENLKNSEPDLILFSYHGLPLRQLAKNACQSLCDQKMHCPQHQATHSCYRQQCYATSALIANALGLNESQFATSFQSRLGKTPWITPYTDQLLTQLANRGIKKLAIVCPSFVADCLETLEEMGIRAKKQWLSLGGSDFKLIPCLNTDARWVKAISHMMTEKR